MTSIPVALQLYSVREDCAADLFDVFKQVAGWGYDGVEFAGLHSHAPAQIKAQLDDHGLACAGAHVPIEAFNDATIDQTIEDYLTLGCPYLIVPWLPDAKRESPASTQQTAQWFTELEAKLKPHGLRSGFHAHFTDVKPFDNGQSAWDILAQNTPSSFILQYDTANGMQGGADPVAPIRANPGRSVSLHLKEYSIEHGHGHAVIGQGDVPWPDVFAAAVQVGGTQWYVIEQEGHPTLSPMEAAHQSLDNVRAML